MHDCDSYDQLLSLYNICYAIYSLHNFFGQKKHTPLHLKKRIIIHTYDMVVFLNIYGNLYNTDKEKHICIIHVVEGYFRHKNI